MSNTVLDYNLASADETKNANINQADIKTTLDRLISQTGHDRDIWKENLNDLSKVKPTDKDWVTYQQYESGMHPMRQFIEFSQHAKPVVHMELFESKMAIERLSAPHFAMYENLSAVQGPRGNDLTKRCLNEFVSSDFFFLQ